MWPYSELAFRTINYGWDKGLNAFVVKDGTGDFISLLGSNKKPDIKMFGQFDNFNYNGNKWEGSKTDKFQAACLLTFDLKMNDNLDLVTVGTSNGMDEAFSVYSYTIKDPEAVYLKTTGYYRKFLDDKIMITTPDEVFNEGYRWALVGTDRFFVNTPGIGKSLVAGYSTTTRGWDGGHKINGRPGYGWYFGRDAQWSGFALLDFGDFEKVKSILEVYGKYQDLNGKIYHELSTSEAVHYDAADSTPLYIILMGRYLKWTGDINFVGQSWNNVKKAIDFCFSTDTNGDHLIENTLVGHGWVEGGKLYGSSTTLYLAGIWAAALREAADIAGALAYSELSEKYSSESEIVTEIVNRDFWNDNTQFYNYGKLPDGNYNTERTVLPAVPMYFKVTEREKSQEVLTHYAGNSFTSDWGVRILSEESSLFNPRGYHYGSVWPLFTGWTALAEYNFDRNIQGFSHVMNNLKIYENWSLGFVEEVLNGAEYLPSGVCPHQCWSETMVLQPILEGMLGLNPSAMESKLAVSPKLPADWNYLEVRNIRIGESLIDFTMNKDNDKVTYSFKLSKGKLVRIDFSPHFMTGSEIDRIILNGNNIEGEKISNIQSVRVDVPFELKDKAEIVFRISGGISVLPFVPNPNPGQASLGFKILNTLLTPDNYIVEVEGKPESEEILRVYSAGKIVKSTENCEVIKYEDNIYSLKVVFNSGSSKYSKLQLKLNF